MIFILVYPNSNDWMALSKRFLDFKINGGSELAIPGIISPPELLRQAMQHLTAFPGSL